MHQLNKKGVDISVNVIIVAAIALAVLVVLFAIFTGRLGSFSRGISETDTCAQKCSSLDLAFREAAPESRNCGDDLYIAGIYSNAPYGCCCGSK